MRDPEAFAAQVRICHASCEESSCGHETVELGRKFEALVTHGEGGNGSRGFAAIATSSGMHLTLFKMNRPSGGT